MNEPQTFTNVTMYRTGLFGVSRTDCRSLTVTPGVKYAQYNDAIQLDYVEKGKRTARRGILTYNPWLRIVSIQYAIEPDSALVQQVDGGSVSRYTSCDKRYVTDFETKLELSGAPVPLAIGTERVPA